MMYALWVSTIVSAAPPCGPRAVQTASALKLLCDAKVEFFKEGLSRRQSFFGTFEKSVDPSDRVTLLGVEHFNFESKLYPELLARARLKNPKIDCFFVENKVDPNFPESAAVFAKLNAGDYAPVTPEATGFDVETLNQWIQMRRSGVKIHFVDEPGNMTDEDLNDRGKVNQWVQSRDRAMAEKINELFSRGACRAAFYPVGAAHLSDRFAGPTLLSRLRQKHLARRATLLVVAGRNSAAAGQPPRNSSWSWRNAAGESICSPHAVPSRSLGFHNLGGHLPVYYDGQFLLSYGDFESTLVYVCETADCRRFNRKP